MRMKNTRAWARLSLVSLIAAMTIVCTPSAEGDASAPLGESTTRQTGEHPPEDPPLTGQCCRDPDGHARLMDAKGRPGRLCPASLVDTAQERCNLSDMTSEMVCCFDAAGVPRYHMPRMEGPIDLARACDTSGYVIVGALRCPPDNRIPDEPPAQTECEAPPARCCSGPDGLYTEKSLLYSQHRRTVRDRVPKTHMVNGHPVTEYDENGDIVYVEGDPYEVDEASYQACVPTCAGTTDVGKCDCEWVSCCEDEENGTLYAEYGMPDGSATVLFEQTKDPVTGNISRIIPKLCPRACPGFQKNVGFCARTCERPILSTTPSPPKPEDDPDKRKPENIIRCDECPSDPDTARTMLCDPCPPELDLGVLGDELERYCEQLPAALIAEPKRFAEEIKAQVYSIDMQLQAATQVPRRVLQDAERKLFDALGSTGFDSLSIPGAPPNLCDSASPSYAQCLRDYMAKVDDFIARPPGGITIPPSGLSAWTQFKAFANTHLPALERAQTQLTDAILNAQRTKGLNITTAYDDFMNRTLARLGKQPLGSLCAGLSAQALDECIDDALDSVQQELERLTKACKRDETRSDSCAPRFCSANAAQQSRQEFDDLDTLPGGGLGWDELPKDACCTKGSADFRVNSAPKKWQGGQFFERSTRLGTWGWGWSARAGRNMWVALWDDPNDPKDAGQKVDTGAWAYMTAGLQVRLPKPPYFSGMPIPHPACLIDPGSDACLKVVADPWPVLRFGQRVWLATAGGVGNVRLTYAPSQGFRYDWHVRTEVKVVEEVAWEFERGDHGSLEIADIDVQWELYDDVLFEPWSYTVYTPIPFFVEVGAIGRAVAYTRFGLSRTAIGLGAEAGVGGGIVAYLEGGIGVSLMNGRLKLVAGVDAMLVVLKIRAGARVEGGIQQLPPTNPERQVVLAGYCFSVPYEMRMFDGEVNIFAQLRLRLGFVKINKRWSKRLFKWEGVGRSGTLWKRCETKCYDYDGAPAPEVLPPVDALTPPDALPGPDRPPCWPYYRHPSVYSFVRTCQSELDAMGMTMADMCLGGGARPPACDDFPCGPFANIETTVSGVATAITADIDRAARTWRATLEAYAALFPLPNLPGPNCPGSLDKASFDCLKDYADVVRTSPAYAAWRATNQQTLSQLTSLEAQWASRYAVYEQLLSEAKGDFGRLKDLADTLTGGEPCTCDYSLSELGTRGSPLVFKCGGQTCGSETCNNDCPPAYPEGPGYPDPDKSQAFSPEWNACCPTFAPDCAAK